MIHRRRRTGFEDSKEFPIRRNDLIAGRYQARRGAAAARRARAHAAMRACRHAPLLFLQQRLSAAAPARVQSFLRRVLLPVPDARVVLRLHRLPACPRACRVRVRAPR